MEKKQVNSSGEEQQKEAGKQDRIPPNDGMNTPVPDQKPAKAPSKSEAALFKQAENPLGDPHKT